MKRVTGEKIQTTSSKLSNPWGLAKPRSLFDIATHKDNGRAPGPRVIMINPFRFVRESAVMDIDTEADTVNQLIPLKQDHTIVPNHFPAV